MIRFLIIFAYVFASRLAGAIPPDPISSDILDRDLNATDLHIRGPECIFTLSLWRSTGCAGDAVKKATVGDSTDPYKCATLQPAGPAEGFLSYAITSGDYSGCIQYEYLYVYNGNTCEPSPPLGALDFQKGSGCVTPSQCTTFSSARI